MGWSLKPQASPRDELMRLGPFSRRGQKFQTDSKPVVFYALTIEVSPELGYLLFFPTEIALVIGNSQMRCGVAQDDAERPFFCCIEIGRHSVRSSNLSM